MFMVTKRSKTAAATSKKPGQKPTPPKPRYWPGLWPVSVAIIGLVAVWWLQRSPEELTPVKQPAPGASTAGAGLPETEVDQATSVTAQTQAEAGALKGEAVTIAGQVAAAYPDDALSYALLGSAYYNTGQSEEATKHLRRCLELNPKQADAFEILARIAYEKGELEESVRLCQESLKLNPTSGEALNQLGRALMDLGRTEESLQALEKAVRLKRPTSESYYLLGQANLQSGNYRQAKESFLGATRLLPDHTQAYFGLYTACMRLGETEAAAQYREQFLKLEAVDRQTLTDRSARDDTLTGLPLVRRTVARTLFGAAQIYRLHGEADKATELFYRAAFLDGDAPVYRVSLEAIYAQRNALKEGVAAFDRLTSAQPGNPLNYYFLGRLHERLDHFDATERAYRQVQHLQPDWAEGYRALAELYLRANRNLPAAAALARRTVELDPSGAHYYLLAAASSRNNDRAGALEAIEQALRLSPDEDRYRSLLEQLKGTP
jgi:tetratricopeptide (TPR) repeat protein